MAVAAYPIPYSAYPYPAQPYHGSSYSPNPAAFSSYYGGQFDVLFTAPYNCHYIATSSVADHHSILIFAICLQQQSLQHSPSLYNSGAAGQQYLPVVLRKLAGRPRRR
ncbi:eyes absent 1-like [Aphis craccivora]|uniref:Eyes absent 1-like n=1 Tax=Aphis craccivora TaxID=307492 RepID=A0A6G0YR65_APHCR|nr:eyes absent 1-like [Aphis craccivora]